MALSNCYGGTIYDDDIDLEMQSISWNMQNNSFYPVKIESVWSIHIFLMYDISTKPLMLLEDMCKMSGAVMNISCTFNNEL